MGRFPGLVEGPSIANAAAEQQFILVSAIDSAGAERIPGFCLDRINSGGTNDDVADIEMFRRQIIQIDKSLTAHAFENLRDAPVAASALSKTAQRGTQPKYFEAAISGDKQAQQRPEARIRIVARDLLDPGNNADHPESDDDNERGNQTLIEEAVVLIAQGLAGFEKKSI